MKPSLEDDVEYLLQQKPVMLEVAVQHSCHSTWLIKPLLSDILGNDLTQRVSELNFSEEPTIV